MNTANSTPGTIATPPTLPPKSVWRRTVSPHVGPFAVSVDIPDYDDLVRAGHSDKPTFKSETKTVLEDGDEFVAYTDKGGAIKLTVGQVISWGGNP